MSFATQAPPSRRAVPAPSRPDGLRVSPADAEALADLARRHGGLALDPRKTQFFETRLAPLVAECGAASARDLVAAARDDRALAARIVERLTTHTTSFFREPAHFEWLAARGFPDLASRALTTSEPFTIWSAACSTGAELWSAGMEWADWQGAAGRRDPFALIGTDISGRILRAATGATYRDEEVQGVAPDRRHRHLLRSRTACDGQGRPYWRVAGALRARASFEQANLLRLEGLRTFRADVAFLRNVLIYFDPADRDRAVAGVVARLRPGGALLTGHAERLDAARFGLRAEGPSIFRKAGP